MRRVVVTGAAGFIGSHLVARLLRGGYEVRMVDNLSTGREANIADAMEEAPANSRARLYRVNIADCDELASICAGASYVFHLAALSDVAGSIQRPAVYHRSNVDGTVRLLEAVRSAGGVRKVIYAASSTCYGVAEVVPTPETAPIRPLSPYALTKHVGEQYVMHWSQTYGMPVVSLRLFNAYGPRTRTGGPYGEMFGVFLAQKLAGQPLTIIGDGSRRRDFVYVTDVAEAFVRAAESDVRDECINIGSGESQTIKRLCELMGGPIVYEPGRPAEPEIILADISKARRLLDWSPGVAFEDGVARMIETIHTWRNAPVWTAEPDVNDLDGEPDYLGLDTVPYARR